MGDEIGAAFGSKNVTYSDTSSDYKIKFNLVGWGVGAIVILNLAILGLCYWGLEATGEGVLIIQIILFAIYSLIIVVTSYLMRGYLREDAMDWMGLLTNNDVGVGRMLADAMSNSGDILNNVRVDNQEWAQYMSDLKVLMREYETLIENNKNVGARTSVRQATPTIETGVELQTFDEP